MASLVSNIVTPAIPIPRLGYAQIMGASMAGHLAVRVAAGIVAIQNQLDAPPAIRASRRTAPRVRIAPPVRAVRALSAGIAWIALLERMLLLLAAGIVRLVIWAPPAVRIRQRPALCARLVALPTFLAPWSARHVPLEPLHPASARQSARHASLVTIMMDQLFNVQNVQLEHFQIVPAPLLVLHVRPLRAQSQAHLHAIC